MYKTYIISLNNPIKLIKKLPKYDLDPIWIEGVNGSKLDYNTI